MSDENLLSSTASFELSSSPLSDSFLGQNIWDSTPGDTSLETSPVRKYQRRGSAASMGDQSPSKKANLPYSIMSIIQTYNDDALKDLLSEIANSSETSMIGELTKKMCCLQDIHNKDVLEIWKTVKGHQVRRNVKMVILLPKPARGARGAMNFWCENEDSGCTFGDQCIYKHHQGQMSRDVRYYEILTHNLDLSLFRTYLMTYPYERLSIGDAQKFFRVVKSLQKYYSPKRVPVVAKPVTVSNNQVVYVTHSEISSQQQQQQQQQEEQEQEEQEQQQEQAHVRSTHALPIVRPSRRSPCRLFQDEIAPQSHDVVARQLAESPTAMLNGRKRSRDLAISLASTRKQSGDSTGSLNRDFEQIMFEAEEERHWYEARQKEESSGQSARLMLSSLKPNDIFCIPFNGEGRIAMKSHQF